MCMFYVYAEIIYIRMSGCELFYSGILMINASPIILLLANILCSQDPLIFLCNIQHNPIAHGYLFGVTCVPQAEFGLYHFSYLCYYRIFI